MLSKENYEALTSNLSIDFDSILSHDNAQNASMQQQIAGCIYMVSCLEAELSARNALEQRLSSQDIPDSLRQEYNTAIGNITDKLSELTISFGKASVAVDLNNLDAYDFLLTFLKFVANNASIYLS